MGIDYKKLSLAVLGEARNGKNGALEDLLTILKEYERDRLEIVDSGENIFNLENFKTSHEINKEIRKIISRKVTSRLASSNDMEIYKKSLLFDAPYEFDSYLRYIEWNRAKTKKFYEPRRKQLMPVVEALQELSERKIRILGISLPPGVGKSSLAIFFLCWVSGQHPELQSLGGSHSNEFLRGVYGECLRILDPNGEYLWHDVFPNVSVVKTDAKGLRIDLGSRKRFETLEFSSIGSGNAGKVRATDLLYCDDLVEGLEVASSQFRLEKLWQAYTTDLRQRKQGDFVAELHIATRWSVHDPIGKLITLYDGKDDAKFLSIPALDENDESNFDYPYGVGFSTEFYHEQRESMEDINWKALYMNQPIEREGRLYDEDELRRYFELPDREPDAIISVLDIADNGGDSWSMPVAYQYGHDYYIDKWIFDNGKPNIVEERIVETLLSCDVDISQFESNRGGGRVAESIQRKIKERGGKTHITTKWNETNKETRIIVSSGYVKEHFLFKDKSKYDKEYRKAMEELLAYSMVGKNRTDDAPDSISMLVNFATNGKPVKLEIKKRNF